MAFWVVPGTSFTGQSRGRPVPPGSVLQLAHRHEPFRQPLKDFSQKLGRSGNKNAPFTSDPLRSQNTDRGSNPSLCRKPGPRREGGGGQG